MKGTIYSRGERKLEENEKHREETDFVRNEDLAPFFMLLEKGKLPKMTKGARNMQTARAGEAFVVAELNRRGAFATGFAGNLPGADIIASSANMTRKIFIQVKTKRKGTWQTTFDKGKPCKRNSKETNYWVFVDLEREHPEYYVCPEWWIRNDIFQAHAGYLKKHRGKRKVNPQSKHHSIGKARIEEWKDRWDILKVF